MSKTKKIVIFSTVGVILFAIFCWRIYQLGVSPAKRELIDRWYSQKDEIRIYDEHQNNITEQFFSDIEWDYKLKNYKNISDYIDKIGSLLIAHE